MLLKLVNDFFSNIKKKDEVNTFYLGNGWWKDCLLFINDITLCSSKILFKNKKIFFRHYHDYVDLFSMKALTELRCEILVITSLLKSDGIFFKDVFTVFYAQLITILIFSRVATKLQSAYVLAKDGRAGICMLAYLR